MATGSDFPTDLDAFINKVDNVDDVLSAETNKQSSALEALEAKVGIDSSAVTSSLDYKVTQLEIVIGNGEVNVADGVVGDPSLSFISDPDTGIYLAGANDIGITANGQRQIGVADGAVTVGYADYDRFEIADDGTTKAMISKMSYDDSVDFSFNHYFDGTAHSYDATRHSLTVRMTGSTTDANYAWYVAQPSATPSFQLLMQLREAGSLQLGAVGATQRITMQAVSAESCSLFANAYWDGSVYDNFDTTRHGWLITYETSVATPRIRWYIAQPTAGEPSWTELMRLEEAGDLQLLTGNLYLPSGAIDVTGKLSGYSLRLRDDTSVAKLPYRTVAPSDSVDNGSMVTGYVGSTPYIYARINGSWEAFPLTVPASISRVRVYRATTNQTITANTITKVQFNAENYDNLNEFDPVTNYRFTATQAGYYSVKAQIVWTAIGAGDFLEAWIYVNGVAVSGNLEQCPNTNIGHNHLLDDVPLGIGDYIEVHVRNVSDGAEVVLGSTESYLAIHKTS